MDFNPTFFRPLLLGAISLCLAACGTLSIPAAKCDKVGDIEPVCRFSNPEDMELLPDKKTLIISQIGNMEGTAAGKLVFFDTASQSLSPAFPPPPGTAAPLGGDNWGAKNCPGIPGPEFSPIGISLRQRNDGRWQLAAVNQGGRTSVEMFELLPRGDGYALGWRGCVPPPANINMNDVALLRDGGFVATHMFDRLAPRVFGYSTGIWKSQFGFDTGYVFEWLPSASETFRVLAGSHGSFPNGIQLSADDLSVFANFTSNNEIRKLDRKSGKKLLSAELVRPDNLSWDRNGFLLGASLSGGAMGLFNCHRHPGETCGFAFSIVRIDPETMATETVFRHEGEPMGAATVAQQVGDWLYIGSFTGNRIIKAPYNKYTK